MNICLDCRNCMRIGYSGPHLFCKKSPGGRDVVTGQQRYYSCKSVREEHGDKDCPQFEERVSWPVSLYRWLSGVR
jgi:hypothetical protein